MRYFRKLLRIFVTLSSVILIGYIRVYLTPVLGENSPYLAFIPAIIMSAAYGGFPHGILAVVVSFFIANIYIISPHDAIKFTGPGDFSEALVFYAVGVVVSWFIDTSNNTKNEIRKYYTAFEQADDGIFITGENGNIKYVNDAFQRMSGFNKFEVIGKTPRIFKTDKHNDKFYDYLWKAIKNGKTFRGTFVNRKKNQDLFYVDQTITPIKDSFGQIINFVGIWKDITKQKEIEKRKDEFMSIASHELKTPLTSIKGYVQIISKKLKISKNKELLNYTKRMEIQINNMANLVYELLDVTRITAGKLPIIKEDFDLNKLMRESVKDMQITSGNKIIYKTNDKKLNVYGDRERISQVIKNLLSNALKYANNDKDIIVKTGKIDGKIQVSVEDFGVGISKDEQTKIFERFYQSTKTIGNAQPSFGIGLYIAAKIIQQHQGKIWVESRENEGSTFFFTIPSVS